MKRTPLNPFLWLTVFVGCSGLLTTTPQPVSGQTNSAVVQQLNELKKAKQLNQQVIQLYQQGKYNEAIPIAERVLEIRERLLGENHLNVASSMAWLAGLYSSQGRYSQAEPLYKQALEMRQKLLGTEHPSVASSLNNLAYLYSSQGRYSQAEPLYKQALEMRQKLLGTEHPSVASSLNNLAYLYQVQGDTTQAINFLSRGLEVQEQNLNVLLATGSERQKQDSMKTVSGTSLICSFSAY